MSETKGDKTLEINDCKKGAKTVDEIYEKFDADVTCMQCENICYCQGVISCKYSRVN